MRAKYSTSQLTVPVGQIASVLDVTAVAVAPVYAKAARETTASVILIAASVPTRGRRAASEAVLDVENWNKQLNIPLYLTTTQNANYICPHICSMHIVTLYLHFQ